MALAFEALCVCAVLAAGLALIRARAGLFFLAINQAIALRAFSGIADYGQPVSQSFLPSYLFAGPPLDTAIGIFALTVPITWIFTLLPAPKAVRAAPTFPALPRWFAAVAVIYMAAYALSIRSIMSVGYAGAQQRYEAPAGGVQALFLGVFVYELYRRVHARQLTPIKAFLILFGLCVLTDYSKGSTGLVTGFILAASILFFSTQRGLLARWVPLLGILGVLAAMGLIVRAVRLNLHTDGTAAVGAALSQIATIEEERARTGEGLEERTNGTQLASHVLECIALYDSGKSREWRSYYYPFVYTFQPSFLVKALDLTRPKEAAWELADYFPHGGGIFAFGEMYWNGGYICVIVITALLCTAAWLVDTRRRYSTEFLIAYCMFTPSLMQGVQYGITYPFRGFSNALIAIIAYRIYRRFSRVRRTPVSPRVAPIALDA